jgi:predicted nucleic acid-binding Zn ribbon protein
MKLEAINESVLLYKPSEQDASGYCIKDIVKDALTVKDTKSAILFIQNTPYSFLEVFRDEDSLVNNMDYSSTVPYSELLYLPNRDTPHDVFRNLEKCIETHYPDLAYLDDFALNSGDFGEVPDSSFVSVETTDEGIYNKRVNMENRGYAVIPLRFIGNLFLKVQTLLGYIASINQKCDLHISKEVSTGEEVIGRYVELPFFDSERYVLPIQSPRCEELFSSSALAQIQKCMEPLGYKWDTHCFLKRYGENDRRTVSDVYFANKDGNEVLVYPPHMTEKEIAANVLTSFLRKHDQRRDYDYPFTRIICFTNDAFHFVEPALSPLDSLDHEIARLAVNNLVHLCPFCQRPVLKKSETYCSNSCKTRANNQRRDKVYAMAFQNVPIEQAIETIGVKYKEAIARWYEEAQALANPTDPSTR